MSKKNLLLSAALTGVTLAAASSSTAFAGKDAMKPKGKDEVKCYGINEKKEAAACSVSQKDIDATKEKFKDKFAKSAAHGCQGSQASCVAVKGQLNWVHSSKADCLKKSGFLIENDKVVTQ